MGEKEFRADVAATARATLGHVSNVRLGDSDGEAVFTFQHELLSTPIRIQALLHDVSEYPRHSGFLVFTDSETSEFNPETVLLSLQAATKAKPVSQLIEMVASHLATNLETGNVISLSDVSDSDFDDEDVTDYESDGIDAVISFPAAFKDTMGGINSLEVPLNSEMRLCHDLRQIRDAGLKVHVLDSIGTQGRGLVAISIRLGKLRISNDALEAWGLQASNHLVLLLDHPKGYPAAAQYLASGKDDGLMRLCLGKCAVAKPSLSSAMAAIRERLNGKYNTSDNAQQPISDDTFLPLYLFKTLNDVLNQGLANLLRIRRAHQVSWDVAQSMAYDNDTASRSDAVSANLIPGSHQPGVKPMDIFSGFAKPELLSDHGLDTDLKLNVPFVAVQFALQRVTRCVDYCLVCNRRVPGGFEAVKPYVCPDGLCAFQYFTLGLGPSVEQEILENPYVVDLLISFFYSAVAMSKLREDVSPKGLDLKTVATKPLAAPADNLPARADFTKKILYFELNDFPRFSQLRTGHRFLIVVKQNSRQMTTMWGGDDERYTCRVTSTKPYSCEFVVEEQHLGPLNTITNQEQIDSSMISKPPTELVDVILFRFTHDIDKLETPEERCQALRLLASRIPSVLRIRQYLQESPGRRLSDWVELDPQCLTLLNWIVASNRSFIIQDAEVTQSSWDDPSLQVASASKIPHSVSSRHIKGLPHGWMQFRFVQGSPEKDAKFFGALAALTLPNPEYPTIFAWHGSPLPNWHGIVRTGLDFKETAHGRSFGHGVYLSPEFDTSYHYASRRSNAAGCQWENSELCISSAMGICEVINKPDSFVSSTPHYVVGQPSWVQCRYLLVSTNPTSRAIEDPMPKVSLRCSPGAFHQDPARQLRGPRSCPVVMPIPSVIANDFSFMEDDECDEVRDDFQLRTDSNDYGSGPREDVELERSLMHGEEGFGSPRDAGQKRRRVSPSESLASPDAYKDGFDVEEDAGIFGKLSSFRPGTLDIGTLGRLPAPSWASASPGALKRLARDLREIRTMQMQNKQPSLGWYVDVGNIDNLFQWIVELHSFDQGLPLAQDMRAASVQSVVLELRFGPQYPLSPPFVRVVRPRFLPFQMGGGGHVTAGGAICSELLTNSGWSPVLSLDKVFLQVRLGLCDMDPPARLLSSRPGPRGQAAASGDYGVGEAVEAYRRAARNHGWAISSDLQAMSTWAN